jgi:hypothetical protein
MILAFVAAWILSAPVAFAQTQKTLTNSDILAMTKAGFEPGLVVKDIQASGTNFDVSPQALIDLKNAGVPQSVLEAMLAAQGNQPSPSAEAVHGPSLPMDGSVSDPSKPACKANSGCLLRDGTEVPLKFAADLNSKTAHEGDPV